MVDSYNFINLPFRDANSVKVWMNQKKIKLDRTTYIDFQKKAIEIIRNYMDKEILRICTSLKIEIVETPVNIPIEIKIEQKDVRKKLGIAGAIGLGVGTILTGGLLGGAAAGLIATGGLAGFNNISFNNRIIDHIVKCSLKSIRIVSAKLDSVIATREEIIREENKKTVDNELEMQKDKYRTLNKRFVSTDFYNDNYEVDSLNYEQKQIKKFLEERRITSLYHFTNKSNIYNIKKFGLLSVYRLEKFGISAKRNDLNRYDDHIDCISLSVSRINKKVYKKFFSGRENDGVVIEIDASLLYKESNYKLFCETNAATKESKKGKSLQHFKNMFNDEIYYSTTYADKTIERKSANREINETTDDQAEILFEAYISTKYIKSYKNNDGTEYVCNETEYLETGYNREGYDKDGFYINGYNDEGYYKSGFNREGNNKDD